MTLTTKKQQQMYLLHGSLKAKPGHRDQLAKILLEVSKIVSIAKGCKLYVIGKDPENEEILYVTEIWETKEDHDSSLKLEDLRKLIMKALPILNEQPQRGQEIEILGGAGL